MPSNQLAGSGRSTTRDGLPALGSRGRSPLAGEVDSSSLEAVSFLLALVCVA